jgi:glycosyltransferase involved in cell wall biosynthesis
MPMMTNDPGLGAPVTGSGRPHVSVVIPVYNGRDFVAEAIGSVQAQTHDDWEMILIDDGSDDGSLDLLQAAAASDARISVLRTAGRTGPGPARNAGIDAARGRHVAFLDADDLWHPQKLARQIAWMETEGLHLTCTGMLRRNMQTGAESLQGVPARITRKMMLKTNLIACSTAVFDRDHFGPRHMPALKRRQDYAFWLSLLGDDGVAGGLPLVLATYRQRAVSVSSSKLRAAADTWAMYRGHLGLPVTQTMASFAHYAMRGLLRHKAPGLARRLGWLHEARHVD